MKWAVVGFVWLHRGKVDADNDEGDIKATDLTFDQAVTMVRESMVPLAIIPAES